MTNYVLGVRPTLPGFKTWKICPVIDGEDLTGARGEVGTPQGPIQVSWSRNDNETLSLQIEALENTGWVFSIPSTGFKSNRVIMDGEEVEHMADVPHFGPIATGGEGFTLVQANRRSHVTLAGA